MANKIGTKHSFIPWLRRGLSREISKGEVDTLAKDSNEGSAIKRASLFVKSTFDLTPIEKESDNKEIVQRSETIQVALTGPGDIAGLQPVSILQVVPANGVKNFESNYLPFIEFFEEDIPWRYTPAKEAGDKLRPWLALLVCKKDEFALTTDNNGSTYVSIKVSNNEAYKQIFQSPSETFKNAHVHFPNLELKNDDQLINTVNSKIDLDENVAFSRLLSSRVLEDNTAYTAFLIPAFETGRLSGLMLSFDEIPAQRSSWGATFDKQKVSRQRPLDFPVYYRWEFETSTGDFVALAKRLKPVSTDNLPAALKVDIQRMGNGLNYSIFQNQPTRKVIDVPVATHPIGYSSEPFPARPDEQMIANIMKDLLSKNPVLIENMEQTTEEQPISRKNKKQKIKQKQSRVNVKKRDLRKILTAKTAIDLTIYEKISIAKNLGTLLNDEFKKKSLSLDVKAGDEIDDPWIVPSLYGGKHIMATSLETNDNKNHEWFTELNLDIRHRAAAGMGKKVVQNNQEQFVHRAWEQVELINELNQRLREYLLKLNLNSSIYKSRFNSKYLKDLMLYLQPMKYAPVGKDNLSLDEALAQRGIPSAYASSSFQRLTSNRSLPENVNATTLTDKIVENNIYKWEEHQIKDLITTEQINKICSCYLIGYKFQIHKMKSRKIIKDEPYPNFYFELIPDKDYLKKKIFYKLKEGMGLNEQVIEFVGKDEISITFQKEIGVSVGAYLFYSHEEEGNFHFTPTDNSSGSFRVDINKRDAHKTFSYHDIEYEISKIIKGKRVEGTESLSEIISNYETMNVDHFLDKIENAKTILSNILQKTQSQETTQTTPDNEISSQLNTNINPFNSDENERINQFITEYYQEFLSNPVLQDKYIKELTHSQYPVMAYPVYPEPAYYYLKQISERFILPASGSMPDNSIALFVNNTAFVEAFLCGMNTEMGRELLWREYPTDSRGSYFRKFWDTEIKKDIKEELRSDTFFDILPIHKWEYQEGDRGYMPLKTHKLGQNHSPGKDNLLIFAIKGELLKKYPETIIYLSKASLNGNKILIDPDAMKILPDLSAWLSEDTYIVGFPTKLDELTGNPATRDPGYFLTFMNRPGETRFASRKDNPEETTSNAAKTAASLLVQPSMFGKHISQFLSGWQNAPQK